MDLIMEGDSGTEKVKRGSFTTKYERPKEPYQIRPPVRVPIVTAPKPPRPKVRIPTSFTANLLNQSPLIQVRIFFFNSTVLNLGFCVFSGVCGKQPNSTSTYTHKHTRTGTKR